MAIFSTTISDEEILGLVNNKHKHVLILACHGCMNESLAFVYDLPITHLENGVTTYPAVLKECRRIQDLLHSIRIESDFYIIPTKANYGCVLNLNKPTYGLSISSEHDAILLLSCPSGYPSLKSQTELPIYIITKQTGSLSYSFECDGMNTIIKEGKVHRF